MDDAAGLIEKALAYDQLVAFVRESNKIEGFRRAPSDAEMKAHLDLISRKRVRVEDLERFVSACQPDAVLRRTADIPGVRVGAHIAPPSGPEIVTALVRLLRDIANDKLTPWEAHVAFETLHPFTDGNGRSGRALWLWHMTRLGQQQRALSLGFLHLYYYQTLAQQSRKA